MPRLKESDWSMVEIDYRAGLLSDRQIGEKYGVSHGSIQQQAKKRGWARNLTGRSIAKAEEKLARHELASKLASKDSIATERQLVEATSELMFSVVVAQRSDIKRARATVQRLWELVDVELGHPEELANLGDLMTSPDESGQDKLNDLYQAAIGLPQQIKNVKLLADALKVLIELERRVLKIDEQPDDPLEGVSKMTDAQRASRIAALLSKATA
jgi:hypothetical protein